MKQIIKKDNYILLEYTPQFGTEWLLKKIEKGYYINGFQFNSKSIYKFDEETIELIIAKKEKEYYLFYVERNNDNDIVCFKIHETINLKFNKLIVGRYSNIFNEFVKVVSSKNEFTIGGPKCDITTDDFNYLIKSFPNKLETEKYYYKKVQLILENYFDGVTDYNLKYEKYIKRKKENIKLIKEDIKEIIAIDIYKYERILESLKTKLEHSNEISESEWKKYIAEIILLLFPKYIKYHQEAYVKLKKSKKQKEFIDFILVKDTGVVDVLEVKKPDCNSIISTSTDHENYYASNTLSRVLMQTEKYIYNLNRNIEITEERFDAKYLKEYPEDFHFKIVNPKGLIIIGQLKEYNRKQLEDLEIIRRMYSNIIEIITYDDLILMLKRQIDMLKKRGKVEEVIITNYENEKGF